MTAIDSNAVSLLNVEQELNKRQRGYIRTFTEGYDLAAAIPMARPNIALGYKYFEEDEAGFSNFDYRAVNQNPSTTKDPDAREIEKKASFIASKVAADYRMSELEPNLLDNKVNQRLRKLPLKLAYEFINGTSSTKKGMIGAKEMVTGDFLIGAGSATSISDTEAHFEAFMNYVWTAEELLVRDANTEIFGVLNLTTWLSIQKACLNKGAYKLGSEFSNVLNKNVKTLSETRLVIVRNDDAGNAILPMTETSSSCSMYFFGVNNVRTMDPNTGEMPNGVFAVSDGVVNLRPDRDGFLDEVLMDLMYAPIFPKGSSVRLKNILA